MNRRGFFRRAAAGLVVGAAILYAPRTLTKAALQEERTILYCFPLDHDFYASRTYATMPVGSDVETMIAAEDIPKMGKGEVLLIRPGRS